MKKPLIAIPLLVIALAIGATLGLRHHTDTGEEQASIPLTALIGENNEGFARANAAWRFTFPDDHGAHPAYRTESWYFTGHLATKQGRDFGFQLTFFRLALTPDPPQSTSAWATNQVYRAHFALTDVAQEQFHAFERFSRAALGLSGAQRSPVRIWLEDWAAEVSASKGKNSDFSLQAAENNVRIDLHLQSVKPMLLSNEQDVLPVSGGGRSAFHFYLMTRLRARGTLQVGSEIFEVEGATSLDRAWGAVPVSQGQIALNRFVLRLDDGREILCFQLRRRDGSGIPITTGLLVRRDGSTRRLERRDIAIEVLDHWTSPRDGARYPARWRLSIPSQQLNLEIMPYVADQEMDFAVRYWGGTVQISGRADGQPMTGNGYVELTGYAEGTVRI